MAIQEYFTQGLMGNAMHDTRATAGLYNPTQLQPAGQVVGQSLQGMLDPNSAYIQNARRRGMELANQRGGINSTIAAGASERAAMEAAAPLVTQEVNIQQNREAELANEWASQNNFSRSMLGSFAGTAFQNSAQMLSQIQQYALEDPELYTPEVTSGLSNFFSQNMNDIMGRFFKNGT